MFLTHAINGLCKLLDIKVPNKSKILEYAETVFSEVDEDLSGEIEFEEFSDWVK